MQRLDARGGVLILFDIGESHQVKRILGYNLERN